MTRFISMVLNAFWVGDTTPLPRFIQMATCSIVCTVLSVLCPGDLIYATERVLILSFKLQINLPCGNNDHETNSLLMSFNFCYSKVNYLLYGLYINS